MIKNRVIAMAVTVSLAAGAFAAAGAQQIRVYTDIKGNWAQQDIQAVSEAGIMTGFNDNQFHPDAWMTRSEFTSAGLRTLQLPASQLSTAQGFQQVSKNNWSFRNFDDQDMISEYPQGVYRPENPVRRVEVMAALGGSLNQPLVSEAEANQILSRYTDANEIPANARRQVATAIKYNLFENNPAYGNELRPLEPATRADVAVALNNLSENREIAVGFNPQQTATGTQMQQQTTTMSSSTVRQQQNGMTRTTQVSQTRTTTTTGTRTVSAVNLPSGTSFTGTVATPLFSEFNKPGDEVIVILDRTLFGADGSIVAPAGSQVHGKVTRVVSYNRDRDDAEIGVAFDTIVTPTGEEIAINAGIGSDGVLRAGDMNGIVIHPQRSIAALQAQVKAEEGGLVGTEQGKQFVLEEPDVTLGSDVALEAPNFHPKREVMVGVGDRLQLQLGVNVPGAEEDND